MKEGWELKCLGEICSVSTGKSNTEDAKLDGEFAFFDRSKIVKRSDRFLFDCEALIIAGEGQTFFPKYFNGKFDLHQRAYAIYNFNKSVDIKFVYQYFVYSQKYFQDVAVGATAKSLRLRHFHDLQIPLPSLPEQQRIVSIIDKSFEVIDKAIENTQKNLQNAKELFESYLNSVFENGNWRIVKLSSMTTTITDGDHMPPPKSEFGLPFITISNINKKSHKIDFSNTFKVPQTYFDGLSPIKKPIIGDLLYTVTGSYGIPVLIEDNVQFCFQRHIGLIRPNEKLVSKLLYYWILSPQSLAQANETATGTAQKTVSLKSLRNFSIPEIPLPEQKIIVKQLNTLRVKTQQLDRIYHQKLLDLEELKKSVLNKAFAGEL